jgi:hypothetical protein
MIVGRSVHRNTLTRVHRETKFKGIFYVATSNGTILGKNQFSMNILLPVVCC